MATFDILMITTSATTLGAAGRPTGLWLEELAVPYYAFTEAGAAIRIASIAGGPVPVDPHSVKPRGENPALVERFLGDAAAQAAMAATEPVADAAPADAVFLPGGHGTMVDLPESAALAALLGRAWVAGAIVAAVCHGPAGLVNAWDAEGVPLVRGRRVTAFSDSEERAVGLDAAVPFLLETRLRALGAHYASGPDFEPFAIADGRLVTGQNPASSAPAARLVLDALVTR
ncbi:type 1 glutamine amidotransferase domain-containing protein [Methylobacterium sp. E-005]|uniref:type 1 glutamine amidotransferase domain-containing protein n=1 Tax=Methylobacterium sp. E-005 TaxID=2836549 RepID=UPI001FBC13A3|nr:type 1 glutamine amidotransferase domain-containing protein [Methylobacterium sp. E-005]MCJ2084748.1 type 1 glutamine amidotransferase domain-containing protein [Methylobacterium sp. E-005]